MSASLQHGTAWGELSSSTLRDRAISHAGYATRVAERQRRRQVTGAASSTRRPLEAAAGVVALAKQVLGLRRGESGADEVAATRGGGGARDDVLGNTGR
jgi:hypothetical protein